MDGIEEPNKEEREHGDSVKEQHWKKTKVECTKYVTNSSKAGIESPTSRQIIDSMGIKQPVDTMRFLDRFIQAFQQRQRKKTEDGSNADLVVVEESLNMASHNSTKVSRIYSSFKQTLPKQDYLFDLNKEFCMDDENIEVDTARTDPDMQPEGESLCPENVSTEHDVGGPYENASKQTEGQMPGDILDEALNPEPPTPDEVEMDRMFANNMYPSMEKISKATAPEVGMEFDSRDEAFYFFAVYARRMGFAIKKDSTYESKKTNTIQRQAFSCNRGRNDNYKDNALKQRRTCRVVQTNCQVKLYVKEERDKWKVTLVRLEHNHELAPSEWIVRFMKCHRTMSNSDKLLIEILQETRVPPRNVMKIFRETRGSFRGVPFNTQYLANEQYKKKEKLKNKDVEEVIKLFKEARKNLPGFTHRFDVDEDNTVKSVFWTDQIGKANYSQFGHFISFDTTFSTNQYGMPFAPIIGVDNYGKTVIFGAGLLKDEKSETFEWLFKEFVDVMGNNHPETIITDQDFAMGTAISEALPFTIHRYCNFHIGKNMKENCVQLFALRGTLHEELRAIIRNSFTPEEFESEWHAVLQKHNAEGEPYLDRIFEIRAQWVPAYFMDKLFPFTSSTGRSESTNSLFKSYVKRKDTIMTFFKEYMIIQEKKQSDLDQLRLKSEFKESGNWGYNPMEREAMKVYTDPIYGKFAEEMKKTTAYNIEVIVPSKTYRVVRVAPYRNAEFPKTTYIVEISADASIYSCSCSKMFRDGIQCCHVLKAALLNGLTKLPVSFIHPRWTTASGHEVAKLTERNAQTQTGSEKTHLAIRHAIQMSKVSHILSSVCIDDASYDLFDKGLSELKKFVSNDTLQRMQQKSKVVRKRKKIDDPLQDQDEVAQNDTDQNLPADSEYTMPTNEENQQEGTPIYKDPANSGNQLFNLGQRPQSHYEKIARKLKSKRKPRLCGRCKKPGHTRPGCPENQKTQDGQTHDGLHRGLNSSQI